MQHNIRFTARKLAQRLGWIEGRVYRRWHSLSPFALLILENPRQTPPAAPPSDLPVILPQTYWGEQNLNFALYGSFQIPADFAADRLALVLPLGEANTFSHPEALLYIDGKPLAANDRHHQEIRLDAHYADGQPHTLLLHGWMGMIDSVMPEPGKQVFMRTCGIAEVDPATRAFHSLGRTVLEAADLMPDEQPERSRFYSALDAAVMRLDMREPVGDSFYASVPPALALLEAGLAAAGQPLDVEIIAAGHAHIDVAWLWTLDQTRRKAARTFYTVLHLMKQFPDYHFTQSQPQLYDYIRQDDPALFEAIQQRVAEGRWEVIGGAWVEPDCNLSSGESLVRQLVLGRRFFREHFGTEAESPVLWLPDVFGYAWNLPQLIKQAGLEYFFTIKLGWNQFNKLPMDSFWWQGLDGTRVLTHFSTAPDRGMGHEPLDLRKMATYNANLTAHTALGSWTKLKHKEAQRTLLMSYGYGDGGGGPTREMNENADVLADLPGMPRVRQGKVIDFFRRLEAESGDRLPTWNGELYLELHRGTYTTQSRNKRANRKAEFALHDAEFLASCAALLESDYVYPHDDLRHAWELVCLNQFHDIIPGSSIHEVYVDSQVQYAEIMTAAAAVKDSALRVIQQHIMGDVILINPAAANRWNAIGFWAGTLPEGMRFARDTYTQAVEGGTLIQVDSAYCYTMQGLTFIPGEAPAPDYTVTAEPLLLENAHLRVELNTAGDIIRIYDKAEQREVLPSGAVANQWQAFEDRPLDWDAWDVDIFFDDKHHLAEPAESIRVVETGPLRATLEIKRRILNSTYTQRISLTNSAPRLDFETIIDWRERHILLKVAFPVDILSPVATYEVQWGNVQRPTHRNTSWDWARFEVCGHKWVDLSEGGYGVALLNDCKYGHDIRDNVIRLSLLRAPTFPDGEADQGEQRFAYSLLVHADSDGGMGPTTIAPQAYALNDPLLLVNGNQGRSFYHSLPFVTAGSPNVLVETVKQADDGDGYIIRAYECNRQRGPVTFHFGFPLQSVNITNLLEEDGESLVVLDGNHVTLPIKPYQVVTLRVRAAGGLEGAFEIW
jgi:alpha-mannosidase